MLKNRVPLGSFAFSISPQSPGNVSAASPRSPIVRQPRLRGSLPTELAISPLIVTQKHWLQAASFFTAVEHSEKAFSLHTFFEPTKKVCLGVTGGRSAPWLISALTHPPYLLFYSCRPLSRPGLTSSWPRSALLPSRSVDLVALPGCHRTDRPGATRLRTAQRTGCLARTIERPSHQTPEPSKPPTGDPMQRCNGPPVATSVATAREDTPDSEANVPQRCRDDH